MSVTLKLKGLDDNFDLKKFKEEFADLTFSYWEGDFYAKYTKTLYVDNMKVLYVDTHGKITKTRKLNGL